MKKNVGENGYQMIDTDITFPKIPYELLWVNRPGKIGLFHEEL